MNIFIIVVCSICLLIIIAQLVSGIILDVRYQKCLKKYLEKPDDKEVDDSEQPYMHVLFKDGTGKKL